MSVRALVYFIVVVLSACRGLDDPGTAVGVFFPRHGQSGPQMMARFEGRLEMHDGCLWFTQADGTRVLPIWPGGFGLRSASGSLEVTDSTGRVVAVDGGTLISGGGYIHVDDARRLMGREEPTACGGHGFWVVGQIKASAGGSSTP